MRYCASLKLPKRIVDPTGEIMFRIVQSSHYGFSTIGP